jgi:hypothetical protein
MMQNVIFKCLLDDMKAFCERIKTSVEYVFAKYEKMINLRNVKIVSLEN